MTRNRNKKKWKHPEKTKAEPKISIKKKIEQMYKREDSLLELFETKIDRHISLYDNL